MSQPNQRHWNSTKHILRYLKGTLQYDLQYTHNEDFTLEGFSDFDWVGCEDSKRFTLGYYNLLSVIIS